MSSVRSAIEQRSHWTPPYLVARAKLAVRQKRRPDEPWLTADAVGFLDQWLQPGDRVIEWGSGRSTRWLAQRVAEVRTIEHDAVWAATVEAQTAPSGKVSLVAVDRDDVDAYVSAHPGTGWDLALVDGIHRDLCARRAVDDLRSGGLLVIDNVERYLPSSSKSPEAIGDGFESPEWKAVAASITDWRRWWTTDGVTDTAFFWKP